MQKALTLKQQEAKRFLVEIRCPKHRVVSSIQEINKTFKNYFKALYANV